MAHALSLVTAWVPAAGATFAEVTRRGAPSDIVALAAGGRTSRPSVPDEACIAPFRRISPFAPNRLKGTSTTVLSGRELGRTNAPTHSAYVDSCLRAHGYCHQAALYLRAGGRIVAVVVLLRETGSYDFNEDELEFLHQVHDLLESAFLAASVGRGEAPQRSSLSRHGLTRRELEVAKLIRRGATNAEVAEALGIRPATVKAHATRVFTKFGVRSRTELVAKLAGAELEDPR